MTEMTIIATFLDRSRIDLESLLKAARGWIDPNVASGKALPKTD
jgi:hypothetical protein